MKKLFTLFLALGFSVFSFSQTTLADFDGTDQVFSSWGGAAFAKIANPDASGINVSANVGEFTHDGSGGYIGIQSDGPLDNFDFVATPYFRIKVWVDEPVEIIFKLQNDPNYWENSEIKYQVSAEETSQWIQLAFNFGSVTATNFNRVVLYFDGGNTIPSGAGHKYYFDDIEKSDIPPPASLTYSPLNNATDVQVFSNLSITSNFAMRMIDDTEITDLSTIAWLKENSISGADIAFTGSINSDKTKITIMPDQLLDPSTTYFYGVNDNIIEITATEAAVTGVSASFTTKATAPSMVLYNDFETDGTSLCTVVETMGDVLPAFSLVADPSDAGNQVFKFEKNAAWGGWNRVHIELDRPIDFSEGNVFSMKVYSPIATWVRLKIGNQKDDGGNFSEKDADVMVVNGWQNLYFDYTSAGLTDTDFSHISIYFAGGDPTPNNFLIDDVKGPALTSGVGFDELNQIDLMVYPNPASEYLYISNITDLKRVEIFSVTGQKVKASEFINNKIHVAELPQGVYIISVENNSGEIFTSKFFKF